ncbi:TPA: transcription termination/antitermination protein NusA [Candidatus Falkowbacteria bacterium]|nr:transcription termination/antitermination protein NusA [Candidatus Falkowbacteria bacterium]
MSELKKIIKQISTEKGISEESVYETINSALAAAYRKDFGDLSQNIVAEYDIETGGLKVFDEKTVVEDLTEEENAGIEKLKEMREKRRIEMEETGKQLEKTLEEEQIEESIRKFNPKTEIELKAAKEIKKSYKIDDIIRTPLEVPGEFGRMAAQTAKQVIIQRLREAERDIIFSNFKERLGDVLQGIVQKRDGQNMVIDLDNANALLPYTEQIKNERFRLGDRIKVVLLAVDEEGKGPILRVSRATPKFVEKLFVSEIPEIANGVIAIKAIAREAGSRSKVAVYTDEEGIDPIGSCIGQRGSRIQTIISELNGEKVDIIQYSDNPVKFIAQALMPAKVTSVVLDEENKTATVSVPADQLSLTIGRDGQNVRLAVKLTGWKINIKEQYIEPTPAPKEESPEKEPEAAVETAEEKPVEKKEKKAAKKKTTKKKAVADEAAEEEPETK